MKIIEAFFDGAFLLGAEPLLDPRGEFTRIYCAQDLQVISDQKPIVQVNQVITKNKGTLRGMHFQRAPRSETKFIKCTQGALFNVLVDLRSGSSTFLKWRGDLLTGENNRLVYIPTGFAHGCQILEDDTIHLMMHTDFYSREHEGAIRFDEPRVGINWPMAISGLSEKDTRHPYLPADYKGIQL